MAMNDMLRDVTNAIISRRGENIRSLFEAQIAAAAEHLRQARVPKLGDTAPEFSLAATDGRSLALNELLSDGPIVLTFYRGSWCNFCNVALKVWQQALPDFTAIGVKLFGAAPETLDVCRTFKTAAKLDYELLSDAGHVAANAYGLGFELPALARETLSSFGIDVGALNGNGEWSVPVTATFAIGSDRHIVFSDCGPDYRRRADPKEVLRVFEGDGKR
jgi:peroxiredoxin